MDELVLGLRYVVAVALILFVIVGIILQFTPYFFGSIPRLDVIRPSTDDQNGFGGDVRLFYDPVLSVRKKVEVYVGYFKGKFVGIGVTYDKQNKQFTFFRLGRASDRFVSMWAEHVGLGKNRLRMKKAVCTSAIFRLQIGNAQSGFKLFFEDTVRDTYAELFVAFGVGETAAENYMDWQEKDSEYRSSIIKTFAI